MAIVLLASLALNVLLLGTQGESVRHSVNGSLSNLLVKVLGD
jgi:hypothetical protein